MGIKYERIFFFTKYQYKLYIGQVDVDKKAELEKKNQNVVN